MTAFEKISQNINKALVFISGIFLLIMISLTCFNIFFRLVWIPIRGTFELMGFFGAIVTTFALGYTQIKKGHISVDVLINRFSPATRRILNLINNFACFLFFAIVARQVAKKATVLLNTGEITETLRIIYYPFTYGVAVGCAALSLVFLSDLINIISPAKEDI